jgi:MSHA pilin protein MshA
MSKLRKSLAGTRSQAGFTLIELLIVILIVGILAAVGVPLYIGYTRDAKLAEGKALAGSVLTAAQACAQTKTTGSCDLTDVAVKSGVSSAGLSGDGRWTVTFAGPVGMTAVSPPTFSGGPIQVAGTGANNDTNLRVGVILATTGVTLRCSTAGVTIANASDGEPC